MEDVNASLITVEDGFPVPRTKYIILNLMTLVRAPALRFNHIKKGLPFFRQSLFNLIYFSSTARDRIFVLRFKKETILSATSGWRAISARSISCSQTSVVFSFSPLAFKR